MLKLDLNTTHLLANGRNAVSWEKKFENDVWYVNNISFSVDVKVLFKTVKKVLLRDGINAPGEATMPAFSGSSVESDHVS